MRYEIKAAMFIEGKRVLLTTSHKRIGSGGSMQLFLLSRALVQSGAVVHAAFGGGGYQQSANLEMLRDIGVPLHFFRMSRWYDPFEIARFRRFLKENHFDIIHSHKGGDLSLALLAMRGLPIPALVNTRGVNFPLGLNRFKYNLKRLDRIIVVSEDSKRVMVARGVDERKIRVIYGGVDTGRFRPKPEIRKTMRDSLALPHDAFVFLMVANFVRQKGHSDYLKAAADPLANRPNVFHLFAGKGDDAAFRAEALERGIAERVRFLGFRTDVEDLFAASDASVVSSFAGEGVSGVLRESMACGVPVITTDVGGNAELVRNEETGFVVPMRSPDALAKAMARMIDEDDVRIMLAEEGRKHVLENFTNEKRAEKIFALYEEIFLEK